MTMKAALFDLDGTVIDTEAQYTECWGNIGKRYCPDISDFAHRIKGTTLTQILERYFPDKSTHAEVEKWIDDWEAQMDYPYIRGAREYIESLKKQNIKCAVVTSSNEKKMSYVLRQHPEFETLFDRIFTSEDFTASKPDPDCYLQASRKLNVEKKDCVVFEDAFTGLEAGRRAGIYTIGLATTNPKENIIDKCDRVISDYTELLN